jgi:hypothetical protein
VVVELHLHCTYTIGVYIYFDGNTGTEMGPSFSYIGYSPLKGSREESNTQLILINGRKMVASCMDIATRFARERQLTSSF